MKKFVSLMILFVFALSLLMPGNPAQAAATYKPANYVAKTNVEIKKGPGKTYATKGTLKKYTVIKTLDKKKFKGAYWYKFNYKGKTAWVAAKAFTKETITISISDKEAVLKARTSKTTMYFREKPSSKSKLIFKMKSDEFWTSMVTSKKYVKGTYWYKIKIQTNQYAWVSAKEMTPTKIPYKGVTNSLSKKLVKPAKKFGLVTYGYNGKDPRSGAAITYKNGNGVMSVSKQGNDYTYINLHKDAYKEDGEKALKALAEVVHTLGAKGSKSTMLKQFKKGLKLKRTSSPIITENYTVFGSNQTLHIMITHQY